MVFLNFKRNSLIGGLRFNRDPDFFGGIYQITRVDATSLDETELWYLRAPWPMALQASLLAAYENSDPTPCENFVPGAPGVPGPAAAGAFPAFSW